MNSSDTKIRPARSHRCRSTPLRVECLDGRCLPSGFAYEPIAVLGDPLLDSQLADYFQIGSINNRADVAFVTNLPEPADGSFRDTVVLGHDGELTVLARTGEADPAGGTFGGGVFAPVSVNDRGDVAFAFDREPFA